MKSHSFIIDVAIWLSVVSISVIDLQTPLGFTIWQPYIAVLLLSFWSDRKYYTYLIAFVCTILIIADYVVSPHGETSSTIAIINNMLGIFVLWVVAVLCTLHKKALDRIKIANEELEQKVKERTEELKQAVNQLRKSNNELEHFAYIASHDLQEPLRMITSFINLLSRKYEDNLDNKADEYIWYIKDGAKRMQSLINDLLTYARLTTKQKPLELSDCNKIMMEVLTDLQVNIKESQAMIIIHPLPEIMADPIQLRQLFQNLISNAIKFRSEQNPEVVISSTRQNNEWIFNIKDNGIGIDPKQFERIFMLFQRLHEREKYPGTGIGLTICKKIVERHGGKIWVESSPGKGTSFYFTFPTKELQC